MLLATCLIIGTALCSTKGATKNAEMSEMKAEIIQEMKAEMKDEIKDEMRAEIRAEMKAEIKAEMKDRVDDLEDRVAKLEDLAKIGTLRSCYEYSQYGLRKSGPYMVDPDGGLIGQEPFQVVGSKIHVSDVKCDVSGVLQLYHGGHRSDA